MCGDYKVRWGWLKFMYAYTIIGAGALGLGIVFTPSVVTSVFGWPPRDPIGLGITGSVYCAFAILSVLGLRSPLKFAPVLLLQLCYKSVWLLGVVAPLLVQGRLPAYATVPAAIFATYIIGDLMAIPFSYVFAKEPKQGI